MSKKNKNSGFIATAVLYSLIIIISVVLFIILKNLGTTRKIERETGTEAKGELLYYEINYIGNGHTTGVMEKERKPSGKYVELSKSLYERIGYTFKGWTKNADDFCDFETGHKNCYGDQESVKNLAPVGTTINLYAQWTANEYQVSFDPNGGEQKPDVITVTYDSRYAVLPTVTRTGYTFAGWWYKPSPEESEIEITNSTIVKIADNHLLTAHWTANQYTVTFNPTGGNVSPKNKQVTFDSEYGSFPTPTRTGYTFAGWYTEKSGGKEIKEDGIYKNANDQTVYAHWKANTYQVSFNPNGGSPTPGSKTVTFDSAYGTLPTVSRANYKFLGWYTAASGGTKINTNTKVSTAKNHTLYAHWEANIKVLFGGNTRQSTLAWNQYKGCNSKQAKYSGSFTNLGDQLSLQANRKNDHGACYTADTWANTAGYTYMYIHAGRRKYSSTIRVDGQEVTYGCDNGDQYITVPLNGRSAVYIRMDVYSGYDDSGCCGGKGGLRVYQILLSNRPLSAQQIASY